MADFKQPKTGTNQLYNDLGRAFDKFINQKKLPVDQYCNDLGKIPPHAIDIEEIVLGQLMIDNEAAILVLSILKPECFYKEAHQLIYGVIMNMAINENPINIITVIEELRKKTQLERCGGAHYITSLTQKVTTTAHVEYHAKIVAQ